MEDQQANPTRSRTPAETTAMLPARGHGDIVGWLGDRAGVYHVAGAEDTSRFEWAKAVLELGPSKKEQIVEHGLLARTDESATVARRPANSPLCCDRVEAARGLRVTEWETALRPAMEESR